jgi:diamine N-acetyltransferase
VLRDRGGNGGGPLHLRRAGEARILDPRVDITLREITVDTVDEILRLKVAPHQEGFVATNAKSIAQAHYHPEIAWFRAIYAGDVPIGFVMVEDKPAEHSYYLWRFMIAEAYQGRGYGRRALELVIEHVRTRPGATALHSGAYPGAGSAIPFYEKLGFVLTGEVDQEDGELEMRLDL